MRPGMRVLDVGVGSGVLTIAAARHGAASIDAFDVESVAVRVTNENIVRNDLPTPITAEVGSVEQTERFAALRSGRRQHHRPDHRRTRLRPRRRLRARRSPDHLRHHRRTRRRGRTALARRGWSASSTTRWATGAASKGCGSRREWRGVSCDPATRCAGTRAHRASLSTFRSSRADDHPPAAIAHQVRGSCACARRANLLLDGSGMEYPVELTDLTARRSGRSIGSRSRASRVAHHPLRRAAEG